MGDEEREEGKEREDCTQSWSKNGVMECVKERASGRDREGWRNRAEGDEYTERQRAEKKQ